MDFIKSRSLFDEREIEYRNQENELVGTILFDGQGFTVTNSAKMSMTVNSKKTAEKFLTKSFKTKKSRSNKNVDRQQKTILFIN